MSGLASETSHADDIEREILTLLPRSSEEGRRFPNTTDVKKDYQCAENFDAAEPHDRLKEALETINNIRRLYLTVSRLTLPEAYQRICDTVEKVLPLAAPTGKETQT